MIQVNIYEAKTQLSKLIQKSLMGEEVIIARGNKPVVSLMPVNKQSSNRVLGAAKGKVKILKGFDEPLDDFKEYM